MRAHHGLVPQADLGVRKGQTSSHEDLALDQVETGYLLRHRMFDLNPWVDFDEVELSAVRIDEEFHRAGIVQADRTANRQGGVEQPTPQFGVEGWCRSDLDDFLMAALDGAIAFEEMHQVAVLIAEQLHFDVPRPPDILFEKDVGHAEGGAGLAAGLLEGVEESFGLLGNAHAASATAHGRLDDDRITEAVRDGSGLVVRLQRLGTAGQDSHPCLFRDAAGDDLVAELFEDLGAGSDKEQPGLTAGAGEVRVLGQEAVAGGGRRRLPASWPEPRGWVCRGRRGSARRVCRPDRLRPP